MTESRKSTKPDYSKIDIDDVLAQRRQIALIWSIEDVQHVRPDLSDDHAWEVLQRCGNKCDAEYGLTWQDIEDFADSLFPAPSQSSDA
jgi:hypothetical protein